MGENGAGKSTLIKVLTGVYERDAGETKLAGAAISEVPARRRAHSASARCTRRSTSSRTCPSRRTSAWAASRCRFGAIRWGRIRERAAPPSRGWTSTSTSTASSPPAPSPSSRWWR
ncbi:MAG: ATP-binding cassette domain-containing protein [Kiritimatiellia bacterium]